MYLPENKSRSYVHRTPQYFLTSQSLNLKSQHSTVHWGILIEISPLLTPASTTMFKHVNTYRYLQLENRSCLWKVYPENIAAETTAWWHTEQQRTLVIFQRHFYLSRCSQSSTGGQLKTKKTFKVSWIRKPIWLSHVTPTRHPNQWQKQCQTRHQGIAQQHVSSLKTIYWSTADGIQQQSLHKLQLNKAPIQSESPGQSTWEHV